MLLLIAVVCDTLTDCKLMKEVITTDNLSIGYGKKSIISGINVSLRRGEVTALLGANGIGKSTLLKTLFGELKPIGGHVSLLGQDINNYSAKQLARTVALVSTDRVNAGGLIAEELVALGRQPYTGLFGRLNEEDHRIVNESMECVGISHKRRSYVANLSDGERQKVMIARALAQRTPIIILDEPFSFLDAAGRIEIFSLLSQISTNNNIAILLSSHDISQAIRIAQCLWIINNEHELNVSSPEEAVNSGLIDHIFNSRSIEFSRSAGDFVPRNTPHKT